MNVPIDNILILKYYICFEIVAKATNSKMEGGKCHNSTLNQVLKIFSHNGSNGEVLDHLTMNETIELG